MRVAWSSDEIAVLKAEYEKIGGEIASRLPGRSRTAIHNKAQALGLRCSPPQMVPSANRNILELLADRSKEYRRKEAHHRAKRDVAIERPDDRPYGLLLTGDPHLDDPGCDIDGFASMMAIASNTEGLMAANVGDLTNNWVGGLARLYAHQTTTDDEAVALIEWMFESVRWAWVVMGNHDKWGPVATLMAQKHNVPYVSHGGLFRIESKGGRRLTIDCAHTHKGNSMYNASHGQVKRNFRGSKADIIVGGHTHTGAHTVLRNGIVDQVAHCVRLGAYKKFDDYADAMGFVDESLGPAVLFTVDPRNEHPIGWLQPWYDIEAGVEYLGWLRKKG